MAAGSRGVVLGNICWTGRTRSLLEREERTDGRVRVIRRPVAAAHTYNSARGDWLSDWVCECATDYCGVCQNTARIRACRIRTISTELRRPASAGPGRSTLCVNWLTDSSGGGGGGVWSIPRLLLAHRFRLTTVFCKNAVERKPLRAAGKLVRVSDYCWRRTYRFSSWSARSWRTALAVLHRTVWCVVVRRPLRAARRRTSDDVGGGFVAVTPGSHWALTNWTRWTAAGTWTHQRLRAVSSHGRHHYATRSYAHERVNRSGFIVRIYWDYQSASGHQFVSSKKRYSQVLDFIFTFLHTASFQMDDVSDICPVRRLKINSLQFCFSM